jgi:Reverse transcriptase (RNA-dependent DNA polymerase)
MSKSTVIKQSNITSSWKCATSVVAANLTYNRRTSHIHKTKTSAANDRSTPTYGRMELDSHADTIVLGSNAIILRYTSRECDVAPYSDSYEPIRNVPIVTGATAITSATTGETIILVYHEAIWMGSQLDHSLLNPNQMRHHGIIVQDNPYADVGLQLTANADDFAIPLQSDGTVIYFNSRTPTAHELESCVHVTLSSAAPWNPRDVQFPQAEHHVEEGNTMHHINGIRQVPYEEFDMSTINYDRVSISQVMTDRLISQVTVNGEREQDVPLPKTFTSKERHVGVSAQELSERWFIGLSQAHETIKVTTQNCLRSAVLALSRRYRADRVFERPLLRGDFYTDTMDGRSKSLSGNKYAQVMANKDFFAVAYPCERKSQAGEMLRRFIHEYGRPEKLTFDGSLEQNGRKTEFMSNVNKYSIDYHATKPYRPNHNFAEGVIREVRRKWFRVMVRKNVPKRLWDYGLQWVCDIQNRTSNSARGLDGRCPLEKVTGETVDISEYLDFGFYDWVWFRENAGLGETKLGRWLGVSHRVGTLMSFWVISSTGKVLSRTTVQRVTNLELQLDETKAKCTEYTTALADRVGDPHHLAYDEDGQLEIPDDWSDPAFNKEFIEEFGRQINDPELKEADQEFTPDSYDDTYLNMELALPRNGAEVQFGKVVKRLRDKNGLPIGTAHDNPILDTRMYEVEFQDGHRASLAANAIAENLFAQIDDEGNRHVLFDEIIDHRTNGKQVMQQDAFLTTRTGTKRRRETTIGWEVLIRWKDGSTTWVALKDTKEAYPVQLAEYAVQSRLAEEPAFAWWVPFTLKKRNRIIAKVKSKYWIRTHKFGIKIPKNVAEARAFDAENGNTFWWDAILKELKNVRPAFEVWEKGVEDIPIGYQQINCHLIFDVKMGENYRRKARFVAGGHTTEVPESLITYSSVVSRDSVRIALTIAALNDLKVNACDIQNAYLTADCREKIWTRAGPEFGSEAGTIFIVRKALYGLKSAGAAFRSLLADTLMDTGYRPTKADPDVWLRPAVKPDGFEYYEIVLCYVDDILSISHDPHATLIALTSIFKLKDDKIEEPDMYLGAQLNKMTVKGVECWTMSAEKYVDASVKNVEESLAVQGLRLPTKCFTPLPADYKPELETSPELNSDGVQIYQELIGVLRWAVELGRVDILLEASLMSTYMAMPRSGHLQMLYRMFGYLKIHPKRKIAFDPQHPTVDERMFKVCDWTDFYRDVKEAIPGDMPVPRGNGMTTHCFVDASHGSDHATRRSQTGILIFCNRSPIIWHSKRQNTVEASTFGSEFQAMKNAVELTEALRYKLRMFGVPIEGPTNIFCDNEAVYKNTSLPESTLKKKHHAIAYHRCREAVAAGTVRVAKEGTRTNLSDLFTKLLPQPRREELLDKFTY